MLVTASKSSKRLDTMYSTVHTVSTKRERILIGLAETNLRLSGVGNLAAEASLAEAFRRSNQQYGLQHPFPEIVGLYLVARNASCFDLDADWSVGSAFDSPDAP